MSTVLSRLNSSSESAMRGTSCIPDAAGMIRWPRIPDSICALRSMNFRNGFEMCKRRSLTWRNNTPRHFAGLHPSSTRAACSVRTFLLAYFEMLKRDRSRLDETRRRMNQLPLGAGALAGTGFNLDRNGPPGVLDSTALRNSLDAVSDRDFIIEFISDAALIMVHLSRLCEDMIIYSTSEFAFIELSMPCLRVPRSCRKKESGLPRADPRKAACLRTPCCHAGDDEGPAPRI